MEKNRRILPENYSAINFKEIAWLFDDEHVYTPIRDTDLPFMVNKIKLAHKRCDGYGYVTLRALWNELNGILLWD